MQAADAADSPYDGDALSQSLDAMLDVSRLDAGAVQPTLAPLSVHYRDYALWQRSWLEAGEQARQLEYWQAQLGSEHPVLELPTDYPRPAMPSYRGARHTFAVDAGLLEQLRAIAGFADHRVTRNVLDQRAYAGPDQSMVIHQE
mgnify:CR=1 FL=1